MSIDNSKMEKSEHTANPIIAFESVFHFENWLEVNHGTFNGIWIRFYKKASGMATITYSEALDVALCYGWIDGQLKKFDEQSYIQKFTPRRPKSMWSKRNKEHVARLEKEGKIKISGQKEIEAAKSDGRWDRAYDSPSKMSIPEDFITELMKHSDAYDFFNNLNKTNKYSIAWRLQTARNQDIRTKRQKEILEMMKNKIKFHE
jgi:uncharacterized protein YdeI (YjbR/CyaY-like superfamily)